MNRKKILNSMNRSRLFPDFNNVNFMFLRGRLTVFRSSKKWLICFQTISIQKSNTLGYREIFIFSNIKNYQKKHIVEQVVRGVKTSDNPNQLIDYDKLDIFDFECELDGGNYHFVVDEEYYKKYVEELIKIDKFAAILLYISNIHQDKVFFSPAQLIEKFSLNNNNFGVFVDTWEWNHPDFIKSKNLEDYECITSLANALEKNDVDLFDKGKNNIDWSFWV